jgi:hypothetical protein
MVIECRPGGSFSRIIEGYKTETEVASAEPPKLMTLDEQVAMQAEFQKLKDAVQKAREESVLTTIDGKTMVAVPYWFMRI